MKETGSHADLRHDQAFFGRLEELYQLTRNLQRGRHTLLAGEKGIGKSRLMMEAMRILSGRAGQNSGPAAVMSGAEGDQLPRLDTEQYRTIFIDHPYPMGDFLKEAAEQLYYHGNLLVETGEERDDWSTTKKRLTGLGRIRLQAEILEGIAHSDRPYLVFIDNLDRITPIQLPFLEALLNISVVCSSVVQMKDQFFFKRIWAAFDRIELEPLPQRECRALIDYLLGKYEIHVSDEQLYRREILNAANGNPFHIRNLLWRSSREKQISTDEIRKLRRLEEGPYFNMGPIYIFGAAGFTLFKIFSIGTDNREFYIYFSALGFLVYLGFRVFRNFFLFRPQKPER